MSDITAQQLAEKRKHVCETARQYGWVTATLPYTEIGASSVSWGYPSDYGLSGTPVYEKPTQEVRKALNIDAMFVIGAILDYDNHAVLPDVESCEGLAIWNLQEDSILLEHDTPRVETTRGFYAVFPDSSITEVETKPDAH